MSDTATTTEPVNLTELMEFASLDYILAEFDRKRNADFHLWLERLPAADLRAVHDHIKVHQPRDLWLAEAAVTTQITLGALANDDTFTRVFPEFAHCAEHPWITGNTA